MTPVKDLKLLVKDYSVCTNAPSLISISLTEIKPIARNVLTILINLSDDKEVLQNLAKDENLLESLLLRITVCQLPQVLH